MACLSIQHHNVQQSRRAELPSATECYRMRAGGYSACERGGVATALQRLYGPHCPTVVSDFLLMNGLDQLRRKITGVRSKILVLPVTGVFLEGPFYVLDRQFQRRRLFGGGVCSRCGILGREGRSGSGELSISDAKVRCHCLSDIVE